MPQTNDPAAIAAAAVPATLHRCRQPRNRPRILDGAASAIQDHKATVPRYCRRWCRHQRTIRAESGPAWRGQKTRLADPRQRQQQHRAKQKGGDAEPLAVGEPADHGRGDESQQADDVRGRQNQPDAQSESRFGAQFLGQIDDQRRAGQSVADRPGGPVPNRQSSCPMALESGRIGWTSTVIASQGTKAKRFAQG